MQLRSQKGIPTPRNPFLVVTQVYRKEGIRALYKGCAALVVVCLPFHAMLCFSLYPNVHVKIFFFCPSGFFLSRDFPII